MRTDLSHADLRRLVAHIPAVQNGGPGASEHDLWGMLRDGLLLQQLSTWLACPFESKGVDYVVGIEARGLVYGPLVAAILGVGFVPIRKSGRFLPGVSLAAMTDSDWEGKHSQLILQRHALPCGSRVLLVDDWFTTGSQGKAALQLIEVAGAETVGVSVVVEEGPDGRLASRFPGFSALVRWDAAQGAFFVSGSNRLTEPQTAGVTVAQIGYKQDRVGT